MGVSSRPLPASPCGWGAAGADRESAVRHRPGSVPISRIVRPAAGPSGSTPTSEDAQMIGKIRVSLYNKTTALQGPRPPSCQPVPGCEPVGITIARCGNIDSVLARRELCMRRHPHKSHLFRKTLWIGILSLAFLFSLPTALARSTITLVAEDVKMLHPDGRIHQSATSDGRNRFLGSSWHLEIFSSGDVVRLGDFICTKVTQVRQTFIFDNKVFYHCSNSDLDPNDHSRLNLYRIGRYVRSGTLTTEFSGQQGRMQMVLFLKRE